MKSEIITSKTNSNILRLKKLLNDKDFRYEQSEYVIEGRRAVQDSRNIKEVYIAEGTDPAGIKAAKVLVVSKSVLDSISSTENSQGIVAVAELKLSETINNNARYVFLDKLQDPGNMGTIMRSAAAFGIKGIIFLKGTVDPFSPKVARSAASALSKLEIIKIDAYEQLKQFNIVAADARGTKLPEFKWPDNFILAIGNEAGGLSEELMRIAKFKAAIPISNEIESLNAAVSAAILLYASSNKS